MATINCEFCKLPVRTTEPGVHQHVSGWVKIRDAGGAHGVSCMKREGKWAHGYCVDREARGLTKQMTFDK